MGEHEVIKTSVINAKQGTRIGVLALNQPKKLNALSLVVVDAITSVMQGWATDQEIGLVILTSATDRAFCAGGDVHKLYDCAKANQDGGADDYSYADDFFTREYRLDYLIHTYPKPVLCWANGATMGGGLGLLGAASNKVATENTKLAMPEMTIGLFPDAGGTELLVAMNRHNALFFALTGAVIGAADAVFYEIADYCINNNEYQAVLTAIQSEAWSGSKNDLVQQLDLLISDHDTGPGRLAFDMADNEDIIERLDGKQSYQEVMEVMLGLEAGGNEWLERALQTFRAGCPMTAAIIVEQLNRGSSLDMAARFRMELDVAANCVRGADFVEGVRALLIDKDRKPKWRHADFLDVADEQVQAHFKSLWDVHPLADLGK